MSELKINGQPVPDALILKIKRGQEQDAIAASRADGLKNLFFTRGQDTWVASARRMDLSQVGNVEFKNQKVSVREVDPEVNSAAEGLKSGIEMANSTLPCTTMSMWTRGLSWLVGAFTIPTEIVHGMRQKPDFDKLKRFAE